jgi:3-phenylpropionate/trans-cinnamate dioxygenase ferredoxin subunit
MAEKPAQAEAGLEVNADADAEAAGGVRSVRVARADEIPPGGRKIVDVHGRSIGVFNLGGEYVALRNRCPHQGGPLCSGELFGALSAETPGQYEFERPGEIIRCPWHGWEFDMRSGRSWFDPRRVRVRSYPAKLEAETYPARRAGAYVVVELGP